MKKHLSILALGISALTFAQDGDVALMQASASGMQHAVEEQSAPFELVSFMAHPVDGEGVSLQWNTGTEMPNMVFRVERSRDRMNWRAAIDQDGEGKADGYNAYEVMDLAPMAGISYYRLVASVNGRELEVSDDFAVEYAEQPRLRIENDRIPGHFSMHGNGAISEVRLMNNRGQFVPMQLEYGEGAVYARTEGLEPGTYFVQATVGGTPLLRQVLVTSTGIVGG